MRTLWLLALLGLPGLLYGEIQTNLDRQLDKIAFEHGRKGDRNYKLLESQARDLLAKSQSDEDKGKIYAMLAMTYRQDLAGQFDHVSQYSQEALKHALPVRTRLKMYALWHGALQFQPLEPQERRQKDEELSLSQLKVILDNLHVEQPVSLPPFRGGVVNCASPGNDECGRASAENKRNQELARAQVDDAMLQNELLETKGKLISTIARRCASGELQFDELKKLAPQALAPSQISVLDEIDKERKISPNGSAATHTKKLGPKKVKNLPPEALPK